MGLVIISGFTLYKVASFLLVTILLALNFRMSLQYIYFVQLFKFYFIQIFTVVFFSSVIAVLYAKHSVNLADIISFLGSGYKVISFSATLLVLFLYLYHKNAAIITAFLQKHITAILTLTGVITGGWVIKVFLTTFNINILDILVFALPFYEYFTFGILVQLLLIAILHKRMQLVVVQSYFYIYIYIILFVFIIWVAISAIYSFDIVHHFLKRYLVEAKALSVGIQVILYSILAFNLITISFLGFVLGSRIVKTIVEIVSKHLRNLYQNYIIIWIYDEPGSKGASNAFRKLSRNTRHSSYRRNLILRELVSLYKNLTGDIAVRAKDLYYELKLTEETMKALKYGRCSEKVRAIQEAASFNYKASMPLIHKFIDSGNEVLRMEAQIAMIKLDDSPDALLFLKFYEYTLSEYEYIHIINAIEHGNQNINLETLFESSNDTVVIFALRLSGLLGQVTNYDRIIELLRHGSPKIREAAIFALGQLSLPQSVGPLMDFYQIETHRNKINILKVIQRLPIQSCQPWLIKTIKEEHDYSIRLAALKALQNTNRAGEDIIKISFVEADYELCSLIRHVNDKRI